MGRLRGLLARDQEPCNRYEFQGVYGKGLMKNGLAGGEYGMRLLK